MEYKELNELLDDILLWKRKYRNIFYINIKGNIYIFRVLTKREYFTIFELQKHRSINADIPLLKTCLLYPSYDENILSNRLAGEVESIVKYISDLSGFSKTDEMLSDIEKGREEINLLDNQILLLICKAFPHLTLEQIDAMDYNTLLKYLVLAESILDIKLDITKPSDQNKIDFEKDNATLRGSKNKSHSKQKPRGSVG